MDEKEHLADAADAAAEYVTGGRGFRERLARLVDVKSLVTLGFSAVLCVMTLYGRETTELFNSAVMLVLGFFFGKNLHETNDKNDRNAG